MCATEEKAINTFKSLACTHKRLMITNLHRATLIKTGFIKVSASLKAASLARPAPPSLRRTAAKNIDPKTGASTWALGSHMCRNIRGSLTKKAVSLTAAASPPKAPGQGVPPSWSEALVPRASSERITRSRGREQVMV